MPTPTPTPLPYSAQIADQFTPIYFVMAVVIAIAIFWLAYALVIKPFLRG